MVGGSTKVWRKSATIAICGEVRGRGLLLGLEFNPLSDIAVQHWKQMQSQGAGFFLVPQIEKLIESIPSMYAMQNLLNEFGIYTQVARSNSLVLRISAAADNHRRRNRHRLGRDRGSLLRAGPMQQDFRHDRREIDFGRAHSLEEAAVGC